MISNRYRVELYQKEVFASMVNEKIVRFRIKPYLQEMMLQIVIDILVVALIFVVLTFAHFPFEQCIFVIMLYFVAMLTFHYKVVIQAVIDMRKKDCVTETIKIDKIITDNSFVGSRVGNHLNLFYSSEMQVQKCKIIAIDDLGKKKNSEQ